MRYLIILFILLLFFAGCREKYDPPLTAASESLLVVEGNLDPTGTTSIRLTKTVQLGNPNIESVNNAILIIEGKDNSIRPVPFTGNGYYTSSNLNLLPANEYRLRIKTQGKEYLSDYVVAKITPPIDSISWEKSDKGVTIFANTKDMSNATKYYRWTYEETWEYNTFFYSDIINVTDTTFRPRIFPQEDVSKCWTTRVSSNLLLANSVRLQSDIISKAPITSIPTGDIKLFVRYSILVKQYALDKNGYNFYELLKDYTEGIGSFFAPMPSEIKGNVYCISNPKEPVIGNVTSSTVTEKRIFILNDRVRPWPEEYNFPCVPDTVSVFPFSTILVSQTSSLGANLRLAASMALLPVKDLVTRPPSYIYSNRICVDCRVRGGTTTRPSFW
ncbi:MAG: DUF4249 domain-containing protein [Chitinophagaceae bacterium]